jgi:N-acetylneuraminate synthase
MTRSLPIDWSGAAEGRTIVIAELSGNHGQDFDQAVRLVRAAHEAGADAIKLQTYTPDTLTLDCDAEWFRVQKGTIWEGKTLYGLYGEAYTPWEWQPKLMSLADELGLPLFSTPFDPSSIDFLEEMGVPAYKIASFEIVDLPLIRRAASTGKPLIVSTGMASLEEIGEAVEAARAAGCRELALLKCTSAYPALASEMNLRTIPDMAGRFGLPVGLSDHTLGIAASISAVTLGARIIEKHLTLSRAEPGPDSSFSLEPEEFATLVAAVREAEQAMGTASYAPSPHEIPSRVFRRSLFVVRDVAEGEPLTEENVRSIRPAHGLPPKHLPEVLGRPAARAIDRGTPLSWDLVGERK